MKWFLVLLATSLAACEKLDRTYLPPPGAQFAGGNSNDILVPLETPKQPQNSLTQDFSPTFMQELTPTRQPITFPVTTTSYAFSQTTTFPPIDNYETNIAPINPATGLPIQNVGEISNQQFNPKLPNYIQNPQGNTFSNIQSDLFEQNQNALTPNTEINIGNSLFRQPFSNPALINYSGERNFQKYPNQYLGQDFTNSGPISQTTESMFIKPGKLQNYDTHNILIQPSKMLPLSDILSSQQPNKIGNNEMFTSNGHEDNTDHPNGLDISQVHFSQDQQNHGKSTPQQPFGPESNLQNGIKSKFGPNYDDVLSTTLKSLVSTAALSNRNFENHPQRPQAAGDRSAVILKYENVHTPNAYSYSFETSNGIRADERGIIDDGTKAEGSYSYIGDDGKIYSIYYTADENGFQPHGDHLPTAPPIPEAIKKVIEQAAIDKAAGIVDDGSYDERKYGYMNYYNPKQHNYIQRNKLDRHTAVHTKTNENTVDDNINHKISTPSDKFGITSVDQDSILGKENILNKNPHYSGVNEDNNSVLNHHKNSGTLNVRPQYESKTGYPVNIKYDSPQNTFQYPFSSTSYEQNIDSSNNRNVPQSSYHHKTHQNEKLYPELSRVYSDSDYSKYSNRDRIRIPKPGDNQLSELLNKNYNNLNIPQVLQVFSEENVNDFDSKKVDSPLTGFTPIRNNQDSAHRETIPQVNKEGYNLPQTQFQDTEFPTRFSGQHGSVPGLELFAKSTTSRPIVTTETDNLQPNRNQFVTSTTQQPLLTSSTTIPVEGFKTNYDNDKFLNTTRRPGLNTQYGSSIPFQSLQTITPGYFQASSVPTQPSEFAHNEPFLKDQNYLSKQRPHLQGDFQYPIGTESPQSLDFGIYSENYGKIDNQAPVKYFDTTKRPTISDNQSILNSVSGTTLPKSSTIVTYPQELTSPSYGTRISTSTPYRYNTPYNIGSTSPDAETSLPSTIGTTPSLFLPSTQYSRLPEHSSTTYRPTFPSLTKNQQNLNENNFGRPIISESRSEFTTPIQSDLPNSFLGSEFLRKPNTQFDNTNVDKVDGVNPTYNIEQSTRYPGKETVIGEDFSGPKQPYRFDTQTGYYYK